MRNSIDDRDGEVGERVMIFLKVGRLARAFDDAASLEKDIPIGADMHRSNNKSDSVIREDVVSRGTVNTDGGGEDNIGAGLEGGGVVDVVGVPVGIRLLRLDAAAVAQSKESDDSEGEHGEREGRFG